MPSRKRVDVPLSRKTVVDAEQSTKQMRIAHCSKATATRDLTDLRDKKILHQQSAGGRSTRYSLALGGESGSRKNF